ncbi:hypothetical protein DRP53_01410 [candidate division WOR-3 bacterium]|uniref:Methyltransferase type 11 domain-containing protein n=1 Tax=candidate division WOR-3 bacterium TaxID=2052148 RepID=A0A660SL60_UNCW3|nr:MAG: hypothetical protein DRP53_01410 [candidate division WOR-3 bacterium]
MRLKLTMKSSLCEVVNFLSQDVAGEIAETVYFRRGIDSYRSRIHTANVIRDLEIIIRESPPPGKVLDFGCGFGIQSFMLAEEGYKVVGLETIEDKSLSHFFKGEIKRHKMDRDRTLEQIWQRLSGRCEQLEFKVYDGLHIPYPDTHFDIILAYAVLEHIPQDDLNIILKELYRVLDIKGYLFVFQFPRAESYAEFIAHRLGVEAHDFLLPEKGIIRLLEGYGFKIYKTYRSDLLLKRPRKLVNALFPVLRYLENVLLCTPLSYFAHHINIIARRVD